MTVIFAALLAATSAFAGSFPTCARKGIKTWHEPKTLKDLRDCQQKKAQGWFEDNPNAPDDTVEAFDEFQRAEVRSYLERHPDRASLEDEKSEPGSKLPKDADMPRSDQHDFEQLKRSIDEMGEGGKNGVTPEMAKEIRGFLHQKQGGVSAEMSDLLDSVEKDGAKLSDESVLKLKRAARSAKGEGLELGIAPDIEKWLLDPKTDPNVTPQGIPQN